MGDNVERALEETVPVLQAAKRARLLSNDEAAEVVRQRRDHEYALTRRDASRGAFLAYAAFERELAALLKTRADAKGLKKKKADLIVGKTAARVNLVYSRAVKRFKGDDDLWLHYARHCVKTGAVRAAGRVFASAIAVRPDSVKVWLAAIAFHFDTCGDASLARALAQRALRSVPDSSVLWKEYFRMEVAFLAKLVARRVSIGLPIGETDPGYFDPETGKIADDDSVAFSPCDEEEQTVRSSEKLDPLAAYIRKPLTFWDGGVPVTIFCQAADAVNLSPADRVEYWRIAAEMFYAPPRFVMAMTDALVEKFPACPAVKLIALRSPWDMVRTFYARASSATCGSDGGVDEEVAFALKMHTENAKQNVKARCLRVAVYMHEFARSLDMSHPAEVYKACAEVLRCWDVTVGESYAGSKEAEEGPFFPSNSRRALLELAVKFDGAADQSDGASQSDRQTDDGKDSDTFSGQSESNVSVDDAICKRLADVAADGSVGAWRSFLKRWQKCDEQRKTEVREVLKKKIALPFRSAELENIAVEWLQWETSRKGLREAYSALLAVPPVSLVVLRAAIQAELKVDDGDAATVLKLRSLYSKIAEMASSARDVDFWLDYSDFERLRSRDAQKASAVNWKALKVLKGEDAESFTERQALRNLATAN